jgi:hypothetical protein
LRNSGRRVRRSSCAAIESVSAIWRSRSAGAADALPRGDVGRGIDPPVSEPLGHRRVERFRERMQLAQDGQGLGHLVGKDARDLRRDAGELGVAAR